MATARGDRGPKVLLPRCVGDVKAGVVRTLLEQDGGMELKLWCLVPGAYWMCPADGVPWAGSAPSSINTAGSKSTLGNNR